MRNPRDRWICIATYYLHILSHIRQLCITEKTHRYPALQSYHRPTPVEPRKPDGEALLGVCSLFRERPPLRIEGPGEAHRSVPTLVRSVGVRQTWILLRARHGVLVGPCADLNRSGIERRRTRCRTPGRSSAFATKRIRTSAAMAAAAEPSWDTGQPRRTTRPRGGHALPVLGSAYLHLRPVQYPCHLRVFPSSSSLLYTPNQRPLSNRYRRPSKLRHRLPGRRTTLLAAQNTPGSSLYLTPAAHSSHAAPKRSLNRASSTVHRLYSDSSPNSEPQRHTHTNTPSGVRAIPHSVT